MDVQFSAIQARIMGCMLEKEVTTPDQYPLTLNGLTTACNQKSNREPVMTLSESEVMDGIAHLKNKHFLQDVTGFGSRVPKYQHRFCNTEFSTFRFSDQEKGILCVLLLRGPQTAGELRTRTNRLCEFTDVKEAEAVLETLMDHPKGPFIVKLPREPGKRDSRYQHLFCGEVDTSAFASEASVSASVTSDNAAEQDVRIAVLEQELATVKAELAVLTARLDDLLS